MEKNNERKHSGIKKTLDEKIKEIFSYKFGDGEEDKKVLDSLLNQVHHQIRVEAFLNNIVEFLAKNTVFTGAGALVGLVALVISLIALFK